jgi:hypothetical protein
VLGTKLTLGGGELATFRGDLRHAGLIGEGRVGYRINAGFYQSESFTTSRTGIGDWAEEYTAATDDQSTLPPASGIELVPLDGQSKATPFGVPGTATGEPDDLRNVYGTARFDYYANDGSVFTVDGGASRVENEVFVTGIGRVQVKKGTKPWARAAWAADRFNLEAWRPRFSTSRVKPTTTSWKIGVAWSSERRSGTTTLIPRVLSWPSATTTGATRPTRRMAKSSSR